MIAITRLTITRITVIVATLAVVAIVRAQTPTTAPGAPAQTPGAAGQQAQAPARGGGPQTGTARIRGRVTTGDTGAPIGRAQMRLTSTTLADARTVATDDQGRFEIAELPAGSFTLTAAKSGYLTLSFGQRRPLDPGRPVTLGEGQFLDTVDFRLPKGGVITVRVADEFGEPLPGVDVQVQQYRFVTAQGERALASAGRPGVANETNDLGEVRVSGLPPGEFYVTALMRTRVALGGGERPLSYAPTYHPGTASFESARPVTLGVGQEASVSLSMLTARPSSIRGIVRRSDGAVANPAPRVSLSRPGSSTTIPLQPDGSFAISNVWPGDYRIVVGGTTTAPTDTEEFVAVPIKVTGDDITGLVITTAKSGVARGQVVFDTGTPPGSQPSVGGVSFAAPPGTSGTPRTTWKENWTFETVGLIGPRVIRSNVPAGSAAPWFLKMVMLDGRDVTDTPIDFTGKEVNDLQVVFTQKRTEISGTAVNPQSQPVTDYAAIVFAEDPRERSTISRFIAAGRPNQQGRFTIAGLPPGRYFAAAVESLENGEERDLELLKKLETGASRFTLAEGEARTVMLRMLAN